MYTLLNKNGEILRKYDTHLSLRCFSIKHYTPFYDSALRATLQWLLMDSRCVSTFMFTANNAKIMFFYIYLL